MMWKAYPFSRANCSTSVLRSNRAKRLLGPQRGNVTTPEQIAVLEGIGVSIEEVEGLRWLGCPSAQMNTRGRMQ